MLQWNIVESQLERTISEIGVANIYPGIWNSCTFPILRWSDNNIVIAWKCDGWEPGMSFSDPPKMQLQLNDGSTIQARIQYLEVYDSLIDDQVEIIRFYLIYEQSVEKLLGKVIPSMIEAAFIKSDILTVDYKSGINVEVFAPSDFYHVDTKYSRDFLICKSSECEKAGIAAADLYPFPNISKCSLLVGNGCNNDNFSYDLDKANWMDQQNIYFDKDRPWVYSTKSYEGTQLVNKLSLNESQACNFQIYSLIKFQENWFNKSEKITGEVYFCANKQNLSYHLNNGIALVQPYYMNNEKYWQPSKYRYAFEIQ